MKSNNSSNKIKGIKNKNYKEKWYHWYKILIELFDYQVT